MPKIAICGSQCTGKTTLVQALQQHPKFIEYDFYSSPSRESRKDGFGVNLDAGNLSQLLILSKFVLRTIQPSSPHCIYDRCILDSFAYTSVSFHNGKIAEWVYEYAEHLFHELMPLYDYVFYLPPTLRMVEDGVRDTSEAFRESVVAQYGKLIQKFPSKIQVIDGSVDERINLILQTIHG